MDREALKASGLAESRGNGFSPENLRPKTFRIGSRLDCSWRQPSDMSSYYPYYEKAEARKKTALRTIRNQKMPLSQNTYQ